MDDRKRTQKSTYAPHGLAPDSEKTVRANVEAIEGPASSHLHVDDLLEAVRTLDTVPPKTKPNAKTVPLPSAPAPAKPKLPSLNQDGFQPVDQTVRMSRADAMRLAEAPRQDSTAIMSRADAIRMAEAQAPASPAPIASAAPPAPAASAAQLAPAPAASSAVPTASPAKPSRKLQALAIALGLATIASIVAAAILAMRRH